jgi:HAD superfamily hydrolase (TIGR01509 family)
MSDVDAVILDIDGTLVDSNDAHARAFVDAATELGFRSPPLNRVRGLIGMGGDKLIPAAFGFEAESDDGRALDELKGDIFRNRYLPALRPTPGAAELVHHLARQGIDRVVATSANREDLRLLLEKAGVVELAERATSASDVDESKPEPDIVEAALELAAVNRERTIMIGDTPYDVEAAIRAGVRIVAVRCGGWDDASLAGATDIFDHPADLLARWDESPFAASRPDRS